MFKLKHHIAWFTPLVIFLLVEYLYRSYVRGLPDEGQAQSPFAIYILSSIALILVLLSIFILIEKRNKKEFFLFSVTPALLVVSQFCLMLFFESAWLVILVPVLYNSLLGIYLENMYIRYYKHEKFQDYSFANISGFLNILIIFSFSTAIYGFVRFLGFEVWIATMLILGVVFFCTLQNIWMIYYRFADTARSYVFVIPLILLEFFWILNFLPLSIFVDGFIMAILYYIFIGFARNQILGIFSKRILARYFIISFVVMSLVLLTAKWS